MEPPPSQNVIFMRPSHTSTIGVITYRASLLSLLLLDTTTKVCSIFNTHLATQQSPFLPFPLKKHISCRERKHERASSFTVCHYCRSKNSVPHIRQDSLEVKSRSPKHLRSCGAYCRVVKRETIQRWRFAVTHAGWSARDQSGALLTFSSLENRRLCCAAPALWFMVQHRGQLRSAGKRNDHRDRTERDAGIRSELFTGSSVFPVTRAGCRPMMRRA